MENSETGVRPGLAQRLRAATAELHSQAERSGIMAHMLQGRIERSGYCTLLRNLHDIYAALELELNRHAAHRCIAPIHAEQLIRRAALAADLDALQGPHWRGALQVMPACAQYVSRLHEIGQSSPELLAAHAYVRYLGDLSGGQMLRSVVSQALHLDGEGTRFYDFPEPGATVLARQFRAGLNFIELDDSVASAIVAEARLAFGLHVRLFEELSAHGQAFDELASRELNDKLP